MATDEQRGNRTSRQRIEAAARRMPARRRAIFLAVAVDNESYADIGRRFSLDPVEVEREFAHALVGLAVAMDPRPAWWRRLGRWIAARAGR